MKRKYGIDEKLENVDLSEHIKNARWIEKNRQEEKNDFNCHYRQNEIAADIFQKNG